MVYKVHIVVNDKEGNSVAFYDENDCKSIDWTYSGLENNRSDKEVMKFNPYVDGGIIVRDETAATATE